MCIEEKRLIKFSFPFSLYFKQLFSDNTYVRFINPFSFWRRYRVSHLETCRELNTVQYLESCYRAEWHSAKALKLEKNTDYKDTLTNNPIGRGKSNTIHIFQPRIKLKYRGVSYYIQNALSIDIKTIKVNSDLVEYRKYQQSLDFDNTNTPEIFGSN